jgi:hypothetical protein
MRKETSKAVGFVVGFLAGLIPSSCTVMILGTQSFDLVLMASCVSALVGYAWAATAGRRCKC